MGERRVPLVEKKEVKAKKEKKLKQAHQLPGPREPLPAQNIHQISSTHLCFATPAG
jgi:hypothetical protein